MRSLHQPSMTLPEFKQQLDKNFYNSALSYLPLVHFIQNKLGLEERLLKLASDAANDIMPGMAAAAMKVDLALLDKLQQTYVDATLTPIIMHYESAQLYLKQLEALEANLKEAIINAGREYLKIQGQAKFITKFGSILTVNLVLFPGIDLLKPRFFSDLISRIDSKGWGRSESAKKIIAELEHVSNDKNPLTNPQAEAIPLFNKDFSFTDVYQTFIDSCIKYTLDLHQDDIARYKEKISSQQLELSHLYAEHESRFNPQIQSLFTTIEELLTKKITKYTHKAAIDVSEPAVRFNDVFRFINNLILRINGYTAAYHSDLACKAAAQEHLQQVEQVILQLEILKNIVNAKQSAQLINQEKTAVAELTQPVLGATVKLDVTDVELIQSKLATATKLKETLAAKGLELGNLLENFNRACSLISQPTDLFSQADIDKQKQIIVQSLESISQAKMLVDNDIIFLKKQLNANAMNKRFELLCTNLGAKLLELQASKEAIEAKRQQILELNQVHLDPILRSLIDSEVRKQFTQRVINEGYAQSQTAHTLLTEFERLKEHNQELEVSCHTIMAKITSLDSVELQVDLTKTFRETKSRIDQLTNEIHSLTLPQMVNQNIADIESISKRMMSLQSNKYLDIFNIFMKCIIEPNNKDFWLKVTLKPAVLSNTMFAAAVSAIKVTAATKSEFTFHGQSYSTSGYPKTLMKILNALRFHELRNGVITTNDNAESFLKTVVEPAMIGSLTNHHKELHGEPSKIKELRLFYLAINGMINAGNHLDAVEIPNPKQTGDTLLPNLLSLGRQHLPIYNVISSSAAAPMVKHKAVEDGFDLVDVKHASKGGPSQ